MKLFEVMPVFYKDNVYASKMQAINDAKQLPNGEVWELDIGTPTRPKIAALANNKLASVTRSRIRVYSKAKA